MAFVIDSTVETNLVSGRTYRIKIRAKNEIGFGQFSDIVEIAMVNPPAKPSSPVKLPQFSSNTGITVKWDPIVVPQNELPSGAITYYKLYMDNGLNGDFTMISYTSASLTQISVNNLISGRSYRFKVLAGNFNQEGLASEVSVFFACQAPSNISAPILVKTQSTSMTLKWNEPQNNGGCPLLGYYLMRDDGISGNPTIEVTQANNVTLRG